ncbi:patatin-like phospholipase family protein [Roseiterribacter gracilis]|uniref:Alpha/beta hydrolase n=1 Tax=Roseiterribacter gracilis TaxID=2812848 RepID=A0A8S8XA40_9PROT|nr:alpha/beta hydrolase [Rhodospirillales bacterium TMPK1]
MSNPLRINLALQGGGAHGAFTWGVLDRLLEDDGIEIAGLCGTSAGAMNAAVTAYGLTIGGRLEARMLLERFWRAISDAAKQGPLQPTMLDKMVSRGNMDYSPIFQMFDAVSRVMSPYQLNPTGANPLKDTLNQVVDFARMRSGGSKVPLFICATNVMTGRLKVFDAHDISAEAVMASACLPFMFQAVEVDGEHYWDGGYMGNPPIFPLIYHTDVQDVLIVQINPIHIKELPTSATAIADRVNTLSWNSSLMREMRAIHFVSSIIDRGFDDGGKLKKIHVHTVDAEEEMSGYSVSSKLNADWEWLSWLRKLGRDKTEAFLTEHRSKIGKESSTDIGAKFL